jgi:AGZA family xanthine/uracil permease-like MFS transporter
MLAIGLSGALTHIVSILGNQVMAGMMAGVGIILAKIGLDMTKSQKKIAWISVILALATYIILKDLVYTIVISVAGASLYAVFVEHYQVELPSEVTARKLVFTKPQMTLKIARGALALAVLNIGANISYGLITGQMTSIKPNPVDLNLLTSTQAFADFGTSLLGGAPVETIISATASAPEPVVAGVMMMAMMAVILFFGWLPKIGKYVPASSIAGFLLVLGALVIFPGDAATALAGKESMIGGVTLIATVLFDPFVGLATGAVLKFVLPLIGLVL